ncbi:DUF2125 domain-containing protein [Aliiroseovarius sp. YM-037]|uniref:DUF2125 domain-containing protein n=1 Tax=Aliiroseovarius sp. YM-037 TaxID=3341728 RepID=UPI003A7FFE60
MAVRKSIGAGAALSMLLGTTAAFADVTAQDVWEDWKSYMAGVGYTVTAGTEEMSGDTLTISGMKAQVDIPEGDGEVSIVMPEILFKERGDGTVEVTMPEEYVLTVVGGDANGSLDMEMSIDQTSMTMIASGDDTETAYNFAANEIKMATTRLIVDGVDVDGDIAANLNGYTGTYVMKDMGDVTGLEGAARVDEFDITAVINEPEQDMVVDFSLTAKGGGGTASMTLPKEFDQEDMSKNIEAGFAADGEYTLGEMAIALAGSGDGESFNMNGTMGGADVTFRMDQDGMGLTELVKALDITISGSEIPLPQINVKAAEYGLNFLMPISKSDEPDDFALGVRLVDLAVQDEIWGMFDPAGVLPRDPATLIIDTVGKANWFFNIMDPKAQAEMDESGETPGELHALTLQELELDVAGAQLTGEGDFTFDNSDTTTFDGMPRPTGAIDLQLVGGNGLLDKLVQMGLIPDDQAMGTRMMMGLFAVPGEGEDTLNSKIEINEEGHVLANGQRLK